MNWIEFKERLIDIDSVRHINYVVSTSCVEFHHKRKFISSTGYTTTVLAISATKEEYEHLKNCIKKTIVIN